MSVVRKILSQKKPIEKIRHDAPVEEERGTIEPIFRSDAPFATVNQVDALNDKVKVHVKEPRSVPCPSLVPKPVLQTHY